MNLKLNESENDAFIKSKERSEYSCIGLADFFFFLEKVFICLPSILIFRGSTCDFFLSSFLFFC